MKKCTFVGTGASILLMALCVAGCRFPGTPAAPPGHATGIRGEVEVDGYADSAGVVVVAERQIQGKTASTWTRLDFRHQPAASAADGNVFTCVTDASGRYELLDLPEGRYTVTASRANARGAIRQNVRVLFGSVTIVDIVLTATGSICGTVTLDGTPSGFGTFAYAEGTSYLAATGATGGFTIADVPIGTYDVVFYREGFGSHEVEGVVVRAAETTEILPAIDLRSSTGAVSGTVLLGDETEPLGTLVSLAGTSSIATTDAVGAYLLDDVAPGTYTLVAVRPGYENGTLAGIIVEAGVERSVDDLVLVAANAPPAGTPVFTPPAGRYGTDVSVAISSGTPGATIHVTTDGSAPTRASPIYAAPIDVSGDGTSVTIRAIAVKAGLHDSEVATASYLLDWSRVSSPALDPVPGVYSADQLVQVTCATPGAVIHITTDGSTPSASSPVYADPIPVAGDGTVLTVRAIAVMAGKKDSFSVGGTYSIVYPSGDLAAPVIGPAGYTGSVMQTVTLRCSTPGAQIRYTVDGSIPSATQGTPYADPFEVYRTCTVKAIAYRTGGSQSTVTEATFTMNPATTGVPVDGYPNWKERAFLTYQNLVRMAPQEFRSRVLQWSSTSPGLQTWTATHPLYWDYDVNRAARYHSEEMYLHGFLTHDSWDPIKPGADPTIPFLTRGTWFGVSLHAENVAFGYPSPWQTVIQLLDDPQYPDKPWSYTNGHRFNAMNPEVWRAGVGAAGKVWWTIDFTAAAPLTTPVVPSANHDFPDVNTISFWLNYYDALGMPPARVLLVLDGVEHDLGIDYGDVAAGTYSLVLPKAATTRQYYFLAIQGDGTIWRYPGPGVFMTVGEGSITEEYVVP